MSIARYLSKLGALLGSDGKVPAAGIADGAVTNDKIASGAAVSNIGYTPVNKAGDTMAGTLTLVDGVAASRTSLFNNTAAATTESNRTLGYSTSWQNHLQVDITLSKRGPVFTTVTLATPYESGAVRAQGRIYISNGSASYDVDIVQQGTANRALGSHSMSFIFGDMPIGTWTVYFQARNIGSGSNFILNNYIGADALYVMY